MSSRNALRLGLPALVLCIANCADEGPAGPQSAPPGATDPAIAPRITSTYPADGSTGPFNLAAPASQGKPHFVVELNKMISRLAFRSNWIRIDGFDRRPEIELWDGVVTSPGQTAWLTRVLALRLRGVYYEVGRTYTVTLDTTLVDFTGRHPQQPEPFSFTPEPWFRVLDVEASQYAGNGLFDPNAALTLTFNSAVDSTIISALQVNPPVAGSWRLLAPYRVTFLPGRQFTIGGRYTVKVDASAMDTHGNRLRAAFQSQFGIVPFEIELAYPGSGQTGIPERGSIQLQSSVDLNVQTVQAAIQVTPAVPIAWQVDRRAIYATNLNFKLDTRYTVTVSTALREANGAPLPASATFHFTTGPFRVAYSYPRDGASLVPVESGVNLSCNARVEPNSAAAAFSISPVVRGSVVVQDASVLWQPSVALAPGTIYTVTLSTALLARAGDRLADPYTFKFRTAAH